MIFPKSRLRIAYRGGLQRCLNYPKTVLLAALLIFAVSLSLLRTLKKEFIPSQDMRRVMVNVTLPLGVSMRQAWSKPPSSAKSSAQAPAASSSTPTGDGRSNLRPTSNVRGRRWLSEEALKNR